MVNERSAQAKLGGLLASSAMVGTWMRLGGVVLIIVGSLQQAWGAMDMPSTSICDRAQKFGIDKQWGQLLVDGLIPAPPTSGLCAWMSSFDPPRDCEVATLLYLTLSNQGNPKPPTCTVEAAMARQALPRGNLTSLADRRPLPQEFADPAAVFEEEGPTYRWLFQLLENTHVFTPCADDAAAQLVIPDGWQEVARIETEQGAGPALPLVYVIENNATDQLVFLFRPSTTNFDYVLNFAFNETAGPAPFGNVSVAWGIAQLFEQVWPTMASILDERVVGAAAPPETWVAGYSMGGGAAQLAALATQEYLDARMGAEAPVVDTVLFATPQAGDPELARRYNPRVNARRVDFSADLVPQVPCAPTQPACSGKLDGDIGQLLRTLQLSGLDTSQGGSVAGWEYAPTGGHLPLTPADMPQDNATWAQLTHINLCYSLDALVAGHGCSYHCALSAFGDDDGFGEECWLSQQPEGAPGSQCPNFPNPEALESSFGQQGSSAAARSWQNVPLLLLLVVLGAVLA